MEAAGGMNDAVPAVEAVLASMCAVPQVTKVQQWLTSEVVGPPRRSRSADLRKVGYSY